MPLLTTMIIFYIFPFYLFINKNFCFFVWSTRLVDSGLLNGQKSWPYSNTETTPLSLPPWFLLIRFWLTRIVLSVFIDKNRWFWVFERQEKLILLKHRINILYPTWHSGNADSHFVVSLMIKNNKMGHRINKMGIHFNKVGHRNSKVGNRNN